MNKNCIKLKTKTFINCSFVMLHFNFETDAPPPLNVETSQIHQYELFLELF